MIGGWPSFLGLSEDAGVRLSQPLANASAEPTRALPAAASSRRAALTFAAKVRVLQVKRLALWTLRASEVSAPASRDSSSWPVLLAEHSTPINRNDGHQDPRLETGKRVNLGLAARAFNGLVLEPGVPLSFWRVLRWLMEARGYRLGLEVSAGCLITAIGGGICLRASGWWSRSPREPRARRRSSSTRRTSGPRAARTARCGSTKCIGASARGAER